MQWGWVLVPLAYVVGTFPTAQLVGRVVGVDPTAAGSGNPGATNMTRVAGRVAGVSVLLGDVAKAVVPALVGWAVAGRSVAVLCGAAAVVGHVFPVQRRLRGGKGVATFGGMSLVVWSVAGLVALGMWLVLVRLTHRVSVASLTGAVAIAAGTVVMDRPRWEVAVAAGLAGLVVVRHRSNLARLLRRQEAPI